MKRRRNPAPTNLREWHSWQNLDPHVREKPVKRLVWSDGERAWLLTEIFKRMVFISGQSDDGISVYSKSGDGINFSKSEGPTQNDLRKIGVAGYMVLEEMLVRWKDIFRR